MKTMDEVREKLNEIQFQLKKCRALGEGSSRQARSLEGWEAALDWVLQQLYYRDTIDE